MDTDELIVDNTPLMPAPDDPFAPAPTPITPKKPPKQRRPRPAPKTGDCRLTRTDIENGRSFVSQHGGKLRYIKEVRGWAVFNGSHWELSDELARELAKNTAEGFLREVLDDKSMQGELRTLALQKAVACQSMARVDAMLKSAQSEPFVLASITDFDKEPDLINCLNGVVDLRTGELKPHHPEFMMMKMVKANYHPGDSCPMWEKFISESLGDDEMVAFFQRLLGYALTAHTTEKIIAIPFGPRDGGKTTCLETVSDILSSGEHGYSATLASSSLMVDKYDSGGKPRSDLTKLRGARMVLASEAEASQKIAMALLKRMSGGDKISARKVHGKDDYEFEPTHKVFLATNELPKANPRDAAAWGRIKVIPFVNSVPEDRQDKELRRKMVSKEADGIFSWMVLGCLKWRKNGLGYPFAVTQATKSYQESMDSFEQALESGECFVFGAGMGCSAKDLYVKYTSWCATNNVDVESNKLFKAWLLANGATDKHVTAGTWYENVGLV